MISPHVYSTLNIRQKIIKAAQAVRETETALNRPGISADPSMQGIETFYGRLIRETHPKLKKAAHILESTIDTLRDEKDRSTRIRALNFCRHDLLALNGTEEDEQYFLNGEDLFDSGQQPGNIRRFANAAILDDLRSPFNVGSIFRSADCFGTGELALCGITPQPPHAKLERTAMGTASWVPWKHFTSARDAAVHYRENGYQIAAVERSSRSVSLDKAVFPEKTAFIFGNEEFGITEDTLRSADTIIEIPHMGRKNSMNVAGAFAVVMYRFLQARTGEGQTAK